MMIDPAAGCPGEETLAGFADGSAQGPAREALESHLARCAGCRAEARELMASLAPGEPAPPGLADRVLRRIAPAPEKEGRRMTYILRAASAAAVVLIAGLAFWLGGKTPPSPETPPRRQAQDPPGKPREAVGELGSDGRCLGHLSTDKPVYRPGERLFARAALLGAFDRKPAPGRVLTSFEIRSARGEIVAQGRSLADGGVAPFGWEIPHGLSGGMFTLLAKFPSDGFPDAETTFDVRAYRVPRLRTDLQFLKKAFGPGDEVTAVLGATRAEGGIPAGARVTAVATVDGAEVHRGTLTLDARGATGVTFRLPAAIRDGIGTLSMAIEDGGVVETAAKTIPIVVNRLAITFHPEGGDLVAGLESRVYFEARTPRQEPADVAGRIVDNAGRWVAHFESIHEGRGRVTFVPAAGGRYRAVIEKPSGILEPLPLPEVREAGFSLAALEDAVTADAPVRVRVASSSATEATVGLYIREKELVRQRVGLAAGKPLDLAFEPQVVADGVLRITVFDREGKPRAERLVFRAPARGLRVQVKVDPAQTVPAGLVKVTVRTTDAAGNSVPAVVGLSAVDDALLETIDRRERAPRLPAQALLGTEVRELRDAHVYLAGDAPAALRTDLLLGTQGWRRFAFIDPAKFAADAGTKGKWALALREPQKPFDRFVLEGAVPAPAALPPEAKPELAVIGPAREEPPAAPNPAPREPAAVARGREFLEKRAQLEAEVQQLVWARIYAHEVSPGRPEGARTDFTETVYWHAGLATNEKGEAAFAFHVSDSITTFRLRADGFGRDGALGEADGAVEVRRPFYAEPKFPLEVTAGDRIDLPIALVNGTGKPLAARLEATAGRGLRLLEGSPWSSEIAGGKSARAVLPFAVEPHQGEVELRLLAQAEGHRDDVARRIKVVPSGFPIEMAFGGFLERIVRHEVVIPEGIEPASLASGASVYPSPLASLTQALAALLQEPGGCFEQTSSSNYPNVMALQYMKGHAGVDPALVRRASELVERGYKRLVSFECPKKGYEWFGSDPGHEALTAYGVMEFVDMSRVMSVDISMVDRTRQWLLSRRDGKGGFMRDPKALDSFGGAPQDITDAYILWALTEAGEKGLEKEIAALKERAEKSEDPYLLALAANVLLNAGDRAAADALLARLAGKQAANGSIPGAATSITRSGGEGLEIETASLAILGWLRSPRHTVHSEKAMRWLTERCKSGRFGATQSTILALKAIIAYDAAHARPKRAGKVVLAIDGKAVQEVPFPADQQGPIVIADFSAALAPGRRVLEMRMEDGADMPYSIHIRYHARTPASSEKCKVAVRTALSRAQAGEGEGVDVTVEVANRTQEGLPMATAIVGLPGGLEARADALKELVREGKVDAFETRGREVILYWRSLAPGAKKALVLGCVAAVPGEYSGPASRAYLYYTDEHKDWQPGLAIRIVRR